MDIPGAIIICGLQIKCKGNEATGTMEFDLDGQPLELPVCVACAEFIMSEADRLDNSIGYEVE